VEGSSSEVFENIEKAPATRRGNAVEKGRFGFRSARYAVGKKALGHKARDRQRKREQGPKAKKVKRRAGLFFRRRLARLLFASDSKEPTHVI